MSHDLLRNLNYAEAVLGGTQVQEFALFTRTQLTVDAKG
jgi:hypothetical protein